jgi:integrase
MQKQRFRLYRRSNGTYYAHENETGKQTSLRTKDKREAAGLVVAKNQAVAQPILNVAMAKVYLSAKSPELLPRTWSELIEVMMRGYTGATAIRWGRFRKSAPMRMLENLPIYQTEATHLLAVLEHKRAGVSTNVWLRILHNRALDLGWLLAPVMPKRAWPRVQYGARRAITADEHEKILTFEWLTDYSLFFQLLWETGGCQSDVAHLNAEDINWPARRLFYARRKLANRGVDSAVAIRRATISSGYAPG